MTDKQKELIERMCEVLDYDFMEIRKMTTKEASEWIKENLEDYKYYKGVKRYD